MLYNSINNEYNGEGEHVTFEIDIQKESPNASLGNNFTKMLKDLDFDMQNNQNLHNINNDLNFELSLTTNVNFNDIVSLNFGNETDFLSINPFPTSTPKKVIPDINILNLSNEINSIRGKENIITNKNDIKNENWIINNNDNSITNVNIHVNNINVNGNDVVSDKKDTLRIDNLKEAIANIKLDYDSPLSENMRKYTSQFANSLGKYNNDKILDVDNKDFKDLQGRLIYDTVENYDHFSESEIKIEFSDMDDLNKLNENNFNLRVNYNNNEEGNDDNSNNNQTITSYEKGIKSNKINSQDNDDLSIIKPNNMKNRIMLPDPHDENYIYQENLNKKVRFQSQDDVQKLYEINSKLLEEKNELKKQLDKMTFEKEKEINENKKSYEYSIFSIKQQEKEKEKKYQNEIDDLKKEILSIKASQSHLSSIKSAIENEKDLEILKIRQELTEEKQLQIHNLQKELLKEKEILSQKYKEELIIKENSYNDSIKIINNSLQKCKNEFEDLNRKFTLQKEENHNLILKSQDQSNEIKNLKNDINNYHIESRKYSNELQRKENVLSKLNEEIKKLENQCKQYNELLQKHQNDNALLNSTIKSQQKDLVDLNNIIHDQEKQMNVLSNDNQSQNNDIVKLKTTVQKQKDEILNLNNTLHQLSNDIKQYQKQKGDLELMMKDKQSKQEQIDQLEKQSTKQKEEYNILQEQIQKQKQKLAKLNEAYLNQKNEYHNLNEKYTNTLKKNQQMEKTIKNLKVEVETQKVKPLFNDFNQQFNTYFEKSNPELLGNGNVLPTKIDQEQGIQMIKQKYYDNINQIFKKLKLILKTIQAKEKLESKKEKSNNKVNENNGGLIPYSIQKILDEEKEGKKANNNQKMDTKDFIENRIIHIQNFIDCLSNIFQKKDYELDILKKDINIFESLINKKNFNDYVQQKLTLVKNAYQEELKRNKESYQSEIQAVTETMQNEIKSLNEQLKKCQDIMTLGASVMSTRSHINNDNATLTKLGSENYLWMSNFRSGTTGGTNNKLMNSVNSCKSIGSFTTTNDDKKDTYYSFEEIIQMYPVESNEWIKRDRYLTEKMVRKQVKNEIVQKMNQLQAKYESEKCKLNSYYSMEYNRLATEIKSKCYRAVVRLKSQLEVKMNQVKNLNKPPKSFTLTPSSATLTTTATTKSKIKITSSSSSSSLSQQIPSLQQKSKIPLSKFQQPNLQQQKSKSKQPPSQLYYQNKDIFPANPIKIELKPSFENLESAEPVRLTNWNDLLLDEIPVQLNSHLTSQTSSSNKTKINPASSSTTFSLNSSSNPYFAELMKPISSSISPPSSIFTLTNKTATGIGSNSPSDPIPFTKDNINNDTPILTTNKTKLSHIPSDLTSDRILPSSSYSSATYTYRKPAETDWTKINPSSNDTKNQKVEDSNPIKDTIQNKTTTEYPHFLTSKLNSSTPSSLNLSPPNSGSSDLKKIYQEYTKRLGQERIEKKILMKKMEEYNVTYIYFSFLIFIYLIDYYYYYLIY